MARDDFILMAWMFAFLFKDISWMVQSTDYLKSTENESRKKPSMHTQAVTHLCQIYSKSSQAACFVSMQKKNHCFFLHCFFLWIRVPRRTRRNIQAARTDRKPDVHYLRVVQSSCSANQKKNLILGKSWPYASHLLSGRLLRIQKWLPQGNACITILSLRWFRCQENQITSWRKYLCIIDMAPLFSSCVCTRVCMHVCNIYI